MQCGGNIKMNFNERRLGGKNKKPKTFFQSVLGFLLVARRGIEPLFQE